MVPRRFSKPAAPPRHGGAAYSHPARDDGRPFRTNTDRGGRGIASGDVGGHLGAMRSPS